MLVWLLKRFAWGPLLGVLDQRRRQIASGLDDIVRAKQEMGALKTQYEQELARIEESARQKLVEAVNQGRRIASEIEEEARARAQLELRKTKETLALEVTKAKTVLRDQIVTLAVEAAEKLLRGRLDETKDRALVEQFIAELDGKAKA
ncbi:MAG: ATP synthase F0 subunit B [Omnitrophica WOR_2 bacterium RIFCSPHIGHO2_02_FULL_68_15]|nr:MAG: ATP synthase F0 subunit B [Omnitrophica WOR_2 bacterium RIFCSPHIGHO2_02_FULL_68_15]